MPQMPNVSSAPEMLQRENVAKAVDALLVRIRDNPHKCFVPATKFVVARNGKDQPRLKASLRHLVYYREHGEVPIFHRPACGIAGCVNPAHQRKFTSAKRWEVEMFARTEHPVPAA